jgi:hypothetical protein
MRDDEQKAVMAKMLKILERNHVTVTDLAKFTGASAAMVRRNLDTLSIEEPVYEVRRGMYGLLSRGGEPRGPRGFIARFRALEGLGTKNNKNFG